MHNKKKERKSMSEVVVGLLGFACIVAIVVTLFKSKTLPSIAFIIFPMILGVILVFGGYYSWENIGKLIKSGFPAQVQQRHCSYSAFYISVS